MLQKTKEKLAMAGRSKSRRQYGGQRLQLGERYANVGAEGSLSGAIYVHLTKEIWILHCEVLEFRIEAITSRGILSLVPQGRV